MTGKTRLLLKDNRASILYEHRCCKQKSFDLVICGLQRTEKFEQTWCRPFDVRNGVFKIKYPFFREVERLKYNGYFKRGTKVLTRCSTIFEHGPNADGPNGGHDHFEYYTFYLGIKNGNHEWKNSDCVPCWIKNYCACFFMKDLYIIGGRIKNKFENERLKTCLRTDFIASKWADIASTKSFRELSASSVYEGRIVLSGGKDFNYGLVTALKSAEAYDHHINKWVEFPDMICARFDHGSVSIGNKLFVIGGSFRNSNSEVFDSKSGMFTLVIQSYLCNYFTKVSAVAIGSKILVFTRHKLSRYGKLDGLTYFVYDVISQEWRREKISGIKRLQYVFDCTRAPID